MDNFAMQVISATLGALIFTTGALANEWKLTPLKQALPKENFLKAPKGGLPDGGVATSEVDSKISAAWYIKPTNRYRHAILGDGIEAGALTVETADGKQFTFELPESQVFEDRTPRLQALGGDGQTHIITLLSDKSEGAAIAVFGVNDDKLELTAQTPFIGRSNRWRNIAGIADFDGDGNLQIAEVITPHIGGTLQFWTWKRDKLVASGSALGFSNHAIGSRNQDLSAVEDFNGDGVDDLAVPNARRNALRIMSFSGKANGDKMLKELATIPLPSEIKTNIFIEEAPNAFQLQFGLRDGSRWAVQQ